MRIINRLYACTGYDEEIGEPTPYSCSPLPSSTLTLSPNHPRLYAFFSTPPPRQPSLLLSLYPLPSTPLPLYPSTPLPSLVPHSCTCLTNIINRPICLNPGMVIGLLMTVSLCYNCYNPCPFSHSPLHALHDNGSRFVPLPSQVPLTTVVHLPLDTQHAFVNAYDRVC